MIIVGYFIAGLMFDVSVCIIATILYGDFLKEACTRAWFWLDMIVCAALWPWFVFCVICNWEIIRNAMNSEKTEL